MEHPSTQTFVQRWNFARAPQTCSQKKSGRLWKDLWKFPNICRLNWRNVEEIGKFKKFRNFFGKNNDSFQNTLRYFPQSGKCNLNIPYFGNYNVDYPLHGKHSLKYSTKLEVK